MYQLVAGLESHRALAFGVMVAALVAILDQLNAVICWSAHLVVSFLVGLAESQERHRLDLLRDFLLALLGYGRIDR